MGIAIDFTKEVPSSPRQNAVLIPELAFLIQQHLQPHDLAAASRVCRNWQEAWIPFLYYSVHYHHHQYSTSNQSHIDHQQQHILPFLNLSKHGHWIKSLEVSNLIVSHHHSSSQSPYSSNSSVSPRSPSITTKALSTPCPPPVQDHLFQIQTCSSLNLTQLGIFKTVMTLERLDELLSTLSMLKVFKFEVVNKKEPAATTASAAVYLYSRNGSHGGSISRGYIQQHQSNLLLKPKRISLEGLEQEVVRVIARRLNRNLERLELVFSVTGTVVLSAFEELFAKCGSILKSLSLTRAEISQRDYSRVWNAPYQAEIEALLASLSGVAFSSSPPEIAQSLPLSSPGTMSTSTSSSSISSSYSTSVSSSSSISHQPKGIPVLESLSLYSCVVGDREFASLLTQVSGLQELRLHDCKNLGREAIPSIIANTPMLESLSFSSLPYLNPESLVQLFTVTKASSETNSNGSLPEAIAVKSGLRLKQVQLAYMRQLDDNVMKALALHQGPELLKLSLHWCPHITDEGIIPIFQSCEKLIDLSLCLSKPTLNIFKELTDPTNGKTKPWACSQTLERFEIGGQMFLDRIRASNEHLQPQLYHHTSPNPHHIRNGSTPQVTINGMGNSTGTIASQTSNIIHDPYNVAHHQGYPMYHLWRYNRLSDPFRELQAQLEALPRLTHLGIPAKGVEHLIKKGFGPKVHLRSLALLNQQGRVWSLEEIEDLLRHIPGLTSLICEKNTILASSQPTRNRKEIALLKQQEKIGKLLQQHNVELIQSSSSTGLRASPK